MLELRLPMQPYLCHLVRVPDGIDFNYLITYYFCHEIYAALLAVLAQRWTAGMAGVCCVLPMLSW